MKKAKITTKETAKTRMAVSHINDSVYVTLDDIILFELPSNGEAPWKYFGNDSDQPLEFPAVQSNLILIFLNDVINQLDTGVDRHNLTINIPEVIDVVTKVKIGSKIIEI